MRYIFVGFILLFAGCSIKNYEQIDAKIIIIKSPQLKFADLGYVRHNDKDIELELFVAGQVVKKISINHLICVDEGCMLKGSFNKEYLHASYPDDILQNIILGRKIYAGENSLKIADGFRQAIKRKDVDIDYSVTSKVISFKDKKNRIIFKIKDTK
ncbi:MAG: hypothetical protein QM497_04670 [Sulfurimonas sp.]